MTARFIDLISCTHPERWPDAKVQYAASEGVDTVVVAGDIGANPQLTKETLREIRTIWNTVAFVTGNNEFRRAFQTEGNFDISHTQSQQRDVIASLNEECGGGFVFLEDKPLIVGTTAIIGRNGHWDHAVDPRITPEEAQAQAAVRVNAVLKLDAPTTGAMQAEVAEQLAKQALVTQFMDVTRRTTPVTPGEMGNIVRQAHRDFEELRDDVVRFNADNSIENIVVVTHTVPHIPGTDLLDFGGGKWSPLTMSTMGNSRLKDLSHPEYNTHGKLTHHLFAHQHAARDMEINGVRYISNPCGNPGELRKEGELSTYKPRKVRISLG